MNGVGPHVCELIVDNGYLVTMDDERREIPSGAIAIKDRGIVAVGPATEVAGEWRAARRIDARGALVHPGFIEAHYHTGLHLVRGVLSDAPATGKSSGPGVFIRWINELTDEDEHAGALAAGLEMLQNGYTAFVDAATTFEPDAVAEAAEAVGIRCSVSDCSLWDCDGDPMAVQIDRAPCDRAHVERKLGEQVRRRANSDGLVRAHIALYGIGSASEEIMLAAKKMADDTRSVYHQHQNFMAGDVAVDRARFGRAPLVHLNEIGVLGGNTVLTHMNVMDDDEAEAVVGSGVVVVWHPGNVMYYSVVPPDQNRMPALFKAGVPMGFGTDAAKSWVIGDLPFISYLLTRYGKQYLSPRDIMAICTRGGARAFGEPDRIGSLEVGKKADIVIRSDDSASVIPNRDPVYQMMMISRTRSVDTVIVDGEVVLRNGRSTRLDESAVHAAGRASARRMAERVGA